MQQQGLLHEDFNVLSCFVDEEKVLVPIILVVLGAIAVYILLPFIKPKDAHLVVSGRIEATEIELAARIQGRVSEVFVGDCGREKDL